MTVKKIKTIIKAWITYLFSKVGLVSQARLEIAMERLMVCHSCKIRDGARCSSKKQDVNLITKAMVNGCGCPLKVKLLVTDKDECPRSAWLR